MKDNNTSGKATEFYVVLKLGFETTVVFVSFAVALLEGPGHLVVLLHLFCVWSFGPDSHCDQIKKMEEQNIS